uniref:RSE1/DDB1/CPSF1 first beta-propeller domain-containing protein n=1 Tax=Panagrolaimus davidi TaxID=227884 RepID=A0A914QH04_9BILA
MSVYCGTAIQPSGIKNILYGNFITSKQQNLILVRSNRLDLCEFNNDVKNIKIIQEVSAKGKIIGSVKVKINPSDEKDCVAFLTTKLQLVIYSFNENGTAEIRVMGMIDKGIGNDSTTGVLMVALKRNAIIVHCKSSSIEYITWERSADTKKMIFVTKQYRRYAFIAGIAPLDNDGMFLGRA